MVMRDYMGRAEHVPLGDMHKQWEKISTKESLLL